jgi:hypothetical protein
MLNKVILSDKHVNSIQQLTSELATAYNTIN